MKKCIVAPDSFKGSLSAIEVCDIARESILNIFPECHVESIPIADGGEGTVDCFMMALKGEKISARVHGPYMEEIETYYGKFGDMVVVEMAKAAGMLLAENSPNPAKTTTYGVGELIRHAVINGAKTVFIGLGGSATNDAGCGCAAALGVKFFDSEGNSFIPMGDSMNKIVKIDVVEARELLKDCEITGMRDTDIKMHGPKGAAYIFGQQKGADKHMIADLDKKLRYLDKIIVSQLNVSVENIRGSGAAGAMGAGIVAFLGGTLESGIDTIIDMVDLDAKLADADLLITGEGRIDNQSLSGKAVIGVAKRAKKFNVPVYVFAGEVDESAVGAYDFGVTAMFSINRKAMPFERSKHYSRGNLKETLENVLRAVKSANRVINK